MHRRGLCVHDAEIGRTIISDARILGKVIVEKNYLGMGVISPDSNRDL